MKPSTITFSVTLTSLLLCGTDFAHSSKKDLVSHATLQEFGKGVFIGSVGGVAGFALDKAAKSPQLPLGSLTTGEAAGAVGALTGLAYTEWNDKDLNVKSALTQLAGTLVGLFGIKHVLSLLPH